MNHDKALQLWIEGCSATAITILLREPLDAVREILHQSGVPAEEVNSRIFSAHIWERAVRQRPPILAKVSPVPVAPPPIERRPPRSPPPPRRPVFVSLQSYAMVYEPEQDEDETYWAPLSPEFAAAVGKNRPKRQRHTETR